MGSTAYSSDLLEEDDAWKNEQPNCYRHTLLDRLMHYGHLLKFIVGNDCHDIERIGGHFEAVRVVAAVAIQQRRHLLPVRRVLWT
jgi:hypothetical protein